MKAFLVTVAVFTILEGLAKLSLLRMEIMPQREPVSVAIDVVLRFGLFGWAMWLLLSSTT